LQWRKRLGQQEHSRVLTLHSEFSWSTDPCAGCIASDDIDDDPDTAAGRAALSFFAWGAGATLACTRSWSARSSALSNVDVHMQHTYWPAGRGVACACWLFPSFVAALSFRFRFFAGRFDPGLSSVP
jgi:hypothetical protein